MKSPMLSPVDATAPRASRRNRMFKLRSSTAIILLIRLLPSPRRIEFSEATGLDTRRLDLSNSPENSVLSQDDHLMIRNLTTGNVFCRSATTFCFGVEASWSSAAFRFVLFDRGGRSGLSASALFRQAGVAERQRSYPGPCEGPSREHEGKCSPHAFIRRRTNRPFITNSVDIVALLCLQTAKAGGLSRIVS